mgnify:CR=1 FL=1|tara:strand:+ start:32935 stop:33486 length:552 start_codon:yes stop_codon:yes gene_type:complete
MKNRLEAFYLQHMRNKLIYKNLYLCHSSIPKIESVLINVTTKEAIQNKKNASKALLLTELISSQKSVPIKAKKSISQWKLRKNSLIGSKVTLRKTNMYEFLDRFAHTVLTKDKEFTGLSTTISNKDINCSSYSLGIKDFFDFPELESQYEKFKISSGLNIIINSNAKTKKEVIQLLSIFHFPF